MFSTIVTSFSHPKRPYTYLFISLLVAIILLPLASMVSASRILVALVVLVPIITSIRTLKEQGRYWFIAILLAFLYTFMAIAAFITGNDQITVIYFFIAVVFFTLITVRLLHHILKSRIVTPDEIMGGATTYLLLGIIWAQMYTIIYLLDPTSFINIIHPGGPLRFFEFLVYSYSNIASLGWGAILAVSPAASLVFGLQPVAGALYLAILVARLVGSLMTAPKSGEG